MAKAVVKRDWTLDPCTDAQILKLLVMLKESGIIVLEFNEDLNDHRAEALDWLNEILDISPTVSDFDDVTKGMMGRAFDELA